jgi:hypothetical protein
MKSRTKSEMRDDEETGRVEGTMQIRDELGCNRVSEFRTT